MRSKHPVIYKYYLYQASNSSGLFLPILIIYLLFRGLTLTQVTSLIAFSAVLVVLAEVPTGYIGDRIGRRNTLVVSRICLTSAVWALVFAQSLFGFAVAYTFYALRNAFASGTGAAWLYDTLEAELGTEEYTRIKGRGKAIHQWTTALLMVLSGGLYVVAPTYPFIAAGTLGVVGIAVAARLPKNQQYEQEHPDQLSVIEALPVIRRTLSKPPLRAVVFYMGLFAGVVRVATTYAQPITVDVLETQFQSLTVQGYAIPAEATLGVLYASFMLVSATASFSAGTIEDRLGVRRAVRWIPIAIAAVLTLSVAAPLAVIPAFLLMQAASAVTRPIVGQYLNDHIDSTGRATVLSAKSMVYSLLRVPLLLASGVLADATSPYLAIAVVGALFLAGAAITYAIEPPIAAAEEPEGTRGSPVVE